MKLKILGADLQLTMGGGGVVETTVRTVAKAMDEQ